MGRWTKRLVELKYIESDVWNTGLRPVLIDSSYLVVIEGAYHCLQAAVGVTSVGVTSGQA
jgi:hypothetical protein